MKRKISRKYVTADTYGKKVGEARIESMMKGKLSPASRYRYLVLNLKYFSISQTEVRIPI